MALLTLQDVALLTLQDVAQLLRCSERTVYHWLKSGKLPQPLRGQGHPRWRLRDLRPLIDGSPANVDSASVVGETPPINTT